MPHSPDGPLLDALLDSWDRNNTILVNLLLALPEDTMMLRAMDGSPTFAQLFAHMHYVRLVFIAEDAPEFARALPEQEWSDAHEQGRLAEMLRGSWVRAAPPSPCPSAPQAQRRSCAPPPIGRRRSTR